VQRRRLNSDEKKAKEARDGAAQGAIVIAPQVLRTLAVGLLSNATGRGVPQAFEAKQLDKSLGLPAENISEGWFRDLTASVKTARMVTASWLDGTELETLTLDPSTAQLPGR